MKVFIPLELLYGNHRGNPTKEDIQKNIDALQRIVDGKPFCTDSAIQIDTISILKGIQRKLPGKLPGGMYDVVFEDVPTEYLVPIPDFADIIPIDEWIDGVKNGSFIDYDGYGHWATKSHELRRFGSAEEVRPSNITIDKMKPPTWVTHVAWYNR